MEEVQEQKFVCKFCNKCCFSGKSLGGHMRRHLALIAAAKKEKVKADINVGFGGGYDHDDHHDHGDFGLEENATNSCRFSAEQSSSSLIPEKVDNHSSSMNLENDDHDQDQDNYGLRENPKKSWKISDLRACGSPRKGNICKECGKRFPSSRALAGHMRTHSGKFKGRHPCKKCGKAFDSMRAMYGHMKSHPKRSRVSSESADGISDFDIVYPRKKRSVMRYKSSHSFSYSTANASSSLNENDEVEDAAICLIMLSRGVSNWDGVDCPLVYTDNATSAYFEAKSVSLPEESTKVDAEDVVGNPDEVEMPEKPIEELYSCFFGSANSLSNQNVSQFNELSSEFASGNEKKAELEFRVYEPLCRGEPNESRLLDVSGVELDGSDSAGVVEPLKDQSKAVGMDQEDIQLMDPNPCKKVEFNAHAPELEICSSDRADTADEIFKISEKKREYRCRACNMSFSSHRALGGHSNKHKINGHCSASGTESSHLTDIECNGTSAEAGSDGVAMADLQLTKTKDHECPICFKVFSTGQALGGHKRAHYAGFSESRIKEMTAANQELRDIQNVFDLNLPVITHPGARDDGISLKAWYEPLVISN
ncbi:uncharacterized protein [Coffea arabica]|uniref:C2H2-type domain-containing protein n=1 Tax=Coffea arabica TaxID=13443 RepID=A0ABM4V9Z3_COFAR